MTTDSALQRELKQGRPFRSPAQEAAIAILRTADVLRRRFGDVLEPAGVTPQQYNVYLCRNPFNRFERRDLYR